MARALDLLAANATSDADHELVDLVTWCHQDHQGAPTRQHDGGWGDCHYCGTPWPCPQWQAASIELTRWLITTSTEIIRRAAA
jgi:hypothetical protein